MSDDAEAETVTRLFDEVGRDYVVRILITTRLIAKHDEADNWRRLTQRTDGILVSHALKTLTANLNITAHFTTRQLHIIITFSLSFTAVML